MKLPPDAGIFRADLIRPHWRQGWLPGGALTGDAAKLAAALRTIEQIEFADARTRHRCQQESLRGVIEFAREQSGFWAARLPAGDVALKRLPLLSRRQLRAQIEQEGALRLPAEHGGAVANTTSGSTAEPLRFFVSELNTFYNAARYL